MSLSCGPAYPADADPSQGWAVIRVREPFARSFDLQNEELVDAVRDHAGQWERFADQLDALLETGWSLQQRGGVYATRAAEADSLPTLLAEVAGPGIVAEWTVTDGAGGLFAIGGLVARAAPPPEVFPGSAFPALVENGLTGAQRIVENAAELHAVVGDEACAAAAWWGGHPQELSDHSAHGLVRELEQLAAELPEDDVPSWISEEARPSRMFEATPLTRIAVHPVSALRFTGLLEATRNYSSLTLAPTGGLARQLMGEGQEVARRLGLLDDRGA